MHEINNVILFHLESVNEDVFLRETVHENGAFSIASELHKNGWTFNNYYSTATSTIMTISDLFTGDIRACDKSTSLGDFVVDKTYNKYLCEIETLGYNLYACVGPYADEADQDVKCFQELFDNQVEMHVTSNEESMKQEIDKVLYNDSKFFLFVMDWASAITFQNNYGEGLDLPTKDKNRYAHIDMLLRYVIDKLNDLNKLESTLIVLYGDHGDEAFVHDLHSGFTHAVEPTYSMIKTPLVFYNPLFEKEEHNELVNTTDIFSLIINVINNQDLMIKERKYTFARNLFPLQKSKQLNKSYAVANGDFLLLSSQKGLEMYYTRYSCFRYMNLLNFFRLDSNGKLKYLDNKGRIRALHFNAFISQNVKNITKNYEDLHQVIRLEINPTYEKLGIYDNDKTLLNKIHYNMDVLGDFIWCRLRDHIWKINDDFREKFEI